MVYHQKNKNKKIILWRNSHYTCCWQSNSPYVFPASLSVILPPSPTTSWVWACTPVSIEARDGLHKLFHWWNVIYVERRQVQWITLIEIGIWESTLKPEKKLPQRDKVVFNSCPFSCKFVDIGGLRILTKSGTISIPNSLQYMYIIDQYDGPLTQYELYWWTTNKA